MKKKGKKGEESEKGSARKGTASRGDLLNKEEKL